MTGIRGFIIGFCLSIFGVTLCGRFMSQTPSNLHPDNKRGIKISLFKEHLDHSISSHALLFAEVTKQSLSSSAQPFTPAQISPDGDEDAEIISINFDDQIPIEQEVSSNNFELQNIQDDSEPDISVAALPNDDTSSILPSTPSIDSTPWVTAKTKKASKNKEFEHLLSNKKENLFTENLQQLTKNDEAVSYKVAERIKQSIIFPIPDEILNDENLTPTFIKTKNTSSEKHSSKSQNSKAKSTPSSPKRQDTTFKKASTDSSDTSDTAIDTSGILDSISSWFSTSKQGPSDKNTINTQITRKKKAPTYGTSEHITTEGNDNNTQQKELVDFYASLQETRQEYAQRKIVPSVLKLFFQPGKAEISGTTLTWLKTFSEAATNDDIRLRVQLDASAAPELQKKRLNLLYTIFMDNGVDFKKVDTIFSTTEPNALIIQTVRSK